MRKGLWLALVLVVLTTGLEAVERIYQRHPTQQDKHDVQYVVNNLAERKWYWLLAHMGEMKRAGDRIEPLHPLRFLQIVFTDEKLKCSMGNVKSKGGRFWNELMGGLRRSLSEELGRGNLTPAQVEEFAALVGIDPALIQGSVQQARWDDLVGTLLSHVPRRHNNNRIDF